MSKNEIKPRGAAGKPLTRDEKLAILLRLERELGGQLCRASDLSRSASWTRRPLRKRLQGQATQPGL